jgi:hypothetical protein
MDNAIDETIKKIFEHIPKLKAGIIETAEFFQRYEENKGTTLLCEIIDDIQWIIGALVETNKLDAERNLEINNRLKDIVAALENGDYILVGDLLQYELLPLIEEFGSSLL